MTRAVAPALSKDEIEELAKMVRKKFNINSYCFDVIRFLEFVLPLYDMSFDYEYVDNLPNNLYAYYNPIENRITVLNSVYENALNKVGRDRFTIAHEIGHYFLHRQGYKFARTTYELPAYLDPEWQANTFASFLLIPREKTYFLNVNEIMELCAVSKSAAKIAYKRNFQ